MTTTEAAAPAEHSAVPSAVQVRRAGRVWLGLIRRSPATLTFIAGFWLLGVTTRSLIDGPPATLLTNIGASVPAFERLRWYTLFTSSAWTTGLFQYILATVLLAATGAVIERQWGVIRFLWVGLLCQFFGTLIGVAAVALLAVTGNDWATDLATQHAVGPWLVMVGVLMAYSRTITPRWRRRLRLATVLTVSLLALYGGELDDVLLLSGALAGWLVGILVLTHVPHPRTLHSARRETRGLVAALMLASAIGPVLVSFTNQRSGPFAVLQYLFISPRIEPEELAAICADPLRVAACEEYSRQLRFHGVAPFVLSLLPALLVVLLAYGLKKGRRFAWVGALVAQSAFAVLGLVMLVQSIQHRRTPGARAAPYISASTFTGQLIPLVVPLLLVAVLVLSRRAFNVPAPPGTYRRILLQFGITLVVLWVLYVGVGVLLIGDFNPQPTVWNLVLDFPYRLVPPGYLGLNSLAFVPTTALSTVLFEWVGVVPWAVALVAVMRSFNANRVDVSERDAADARAILRQHGENALSYLTSWQGNTYWFTPQRSSFVAYRVQSGVAIALGDPVGPASETASAMRGFAQFCNVHSWTVCFYSTTDRVRQLGESLGWQDVQVAEEAYLPLGSLSWRGKKFQDIRTAASRAGRLGITARWTSYPGASWAVIDQITAISEEWVASKGLPEMGFTLGGLAELDDPEVRCLLAVDEAGAIHGITSWLPAYSDGEPIGWTLDYMRRRTSSDFKGVMEFLISAAALDFQQQGARFLSLSGAPLARTDPVAPRNWLARLLDRTGTSLEPVYGFRSLLAFKAKFQPSYRPLFMTYPESASLPRIGNAISRAYLPHLTLGQTVRLLRKLRTRRPAPTATPAPAGRD